MSQKYPEKLFSKHILTYYIASWLCTCVHMCITPRIISHIGTGEFASVAKACWNKESSQVEVAVKSMPPNTDIEDRVKLLKEAAMMGQFRHPNVVQLHGIVTSGTSVSLWGYIPTGATVFTGVFEAPYGAMAEHVVCFYHRQLLVTRFWGKQHSELRILAIYMYVYVCDCICMQFMLVLGYLAKGDLRTHLVQLNRE